MWIHPQLTTILNFKIKFRELSKINSPLFDAWFCIFNEVTLCLSFISRYRCDNKPYRVGRTYLDWIFFLILNKTNHQVWAVRMCLHIEGLELWEIMEAKNAPRRKDWQVMSVMFNMISNKIGRVLDIEKIANKIWETLKTKNDDVSHLWR